MLIPEDLNPRAFRHAHRLSQEALARLLDVSFYSVKVWESRGRAGRSAIELLRVRLPQIREELEQATQAAAQVASEQESGGGGAAA
jgi:transcriptional regulator with XRE-family HTH domain